MPLADALVVTPLGWGYIATAVIAFVVYTRVATLRNWGDYPGTIGIPAPVAHGTIGVFVGFLWGAIAIGAVFSGLVWLITRPGPMELRRRHLSKARENVARLERELGLEADR